MFLKFKLLLGFSKLFILNLDKTWTIQLKVDEEEVAVEPHSAVRQLKKN